MCGVAGSSVPFQRLRCLIRADDDDRHRDARDPCQLLLGALPRLDDLGGAVGHVLEHDVDTAEIPLSQGDEAGRRSALPGNQDAGTLVVEAETPEP